MKITRVIAVGIMLSVLGSGALDAQSLRKSAPPAEFPPASYKGKQYVDSRGCIYIRAGIDGNVNWVPRVSRSRKQVCGFKPTGVAGARPAPAAKPAGKPVIITNNPAAAPKPAATARVTTRPAATTAPVKARPVPAGVATTRQPATTPRPARQPARQTARTTTSAPSVQPTPAPAAATQPVRKRTPWFRLKPVKRQTQPAVVPVQPKAPATTARRVPQAAPAQTQTQPRSGNCSNASAFSQQFINKQNGRYAVRCGPQAESPSSFGRDGHSSLGVPSQTRVVRRHVFDNRQNTNNVTTPSGYRTVWQDGRLNPNRAERTLKPAQVLAAATVPPGFRRVVHQDGRLNAARGNRTTAGAAQTNQIWSNTIPRRLLQVPTNAQIVTAPNGAARTQVPSTTVSRTARALSLTSTAAVAQAGQTQTSQTQRLFIRVATYASEGDARSAARSLSRKGLPMNLGHVKSSGNKVLLAGPFASTAQANAALAKVRGAGYRNARVN